jgi:hypothetical protein
MMKNPQCPSARKTGLVIQELPDELLVYDLDTNKAHCLNNTAAFVWKSCDGKTSVSEIAALLDLETESMVPEDLIWLAIDQLSENKLLEVDLRVNFNGQSRRAVIKKIGLASVIALPVIASLVAPQSALANVSCKCPALSNTECTAQASDGCGSVCDTNTGVCVTPGP